MENDFLDGIYWEEWYNKGNVPMEPTDGTEVKYIPCDKDRVGIKGPCPISPRDRMIMYSNRMLGVPRMRQIRVTNQSCLIPEDFKEAIKVTRYLLICSSDGFTNLEFRNFTNIFKTDKKQISNRSKKTLTHKALFSQF